MTDEVGDEVRDEVVKPVRKASTAKTVAFFALLIILGFAVGWGLHNLSTSRVLDTPSSPATSKPKKTDSVTDPRIQTIAPSGATNPSPSATGPGSSTSIVGQ